MSDSPQLQRMVWVKVAIGLAASGLGLVFVAALELFSWQPVAAAVVEVEPTWLPGHAAPVRLSVLDAARNNLRMSGVQAKLVAGARQLSLGDLMLIEDGMRAQATLRVPEDWPLGPAQLELHLQVDERPTFAVQTIALQVAAQRPKRQPMLFGATREVRASDDSQPHPASVRLDMWVASGLVAGVENTFWLRVIDAQGQPVVTAVDVALVYGELGTDKLGSDGRRVIFSGTTARTGVLSWRDVVHSQVLRFEVSTKADGLPEQTRVIRLAAMPGALALQPDRTLVAAGQAVDIQASLPSGSRPVLVDVHDNAGAWVAALHLPRPTLRQAMVASAFAEPGMVTLEGYQGLRRQDPAFASRALWLQSDAEQRAPRLAQGLLQAASEYVATLEGQRFAAPIAEEAYLQALKSMDLDPLEKAQISTALLDRLPRRIYGPPRRIDLAAEVAAQAQAFKRTWATRLRWSLVGGGVMLIASVVALLLFDRRQAIQRTRQVLDDEAALSLQPGWAFWGRLAVVVAIIVTGLVALGFGLERLFGEV